jgi:hypothetical protein
MGSGSSRLYNISLDTLPETILDPKYEEDLKKYQIQILETVIKTPETLSPGDSVNVKFPDGWSMKCFETGSVCEIDFFDHSRVPRLCICANLVNYDTWVKIRFYSDQEIEEKKTMCDEKKRIREEKEMIQKAYEQFVKDNFVRKWSPETDTIVYFFRDGTHQARDAYHGLHKDQDYLDAVVEFSEHQLIGFCSQDQVEKKILDLMDLMETHGSNMIFPKDHQIVSQRLDRGMENLHRFEQTHLFQHDPNLSVETGYYERALFSPKESIEKKKFW